MDASKIIDKKLASLTDWRGDVMRAVRKLIREVDPEIVEEWKWMGTPVWNKNGILCLANAHKQHVKMTFPKGAQLKDPKRVFNAELGGKAWRAIDWREGDEVDVEGVKGLVRAAIALNGEKPAARKAGDKSATAKRAAAKKAAAAKQPAAKRKVAAKKATTKKAAPKRR